ncbi:MAG: aminodeoxychorismate synthase component I [Chloroflexi bacterium]|nr:aminodeoxychorismate synthase component I [Chloroflexota bacterium]
MIGDVILKQDDAWLKFTRPRRVIVTEKLDDVREGLEEVERLVNAHGWTAVGFLSYEAAPAFDLALHVIESHGFPLLWFGLYEDSETIETSEVFKDLGGLISPLDWQPDTEKEAYNNAIQTIKERIAQGKTYQVNYTMRLSTDFETDKRMRADEWALRLFAHLARGQNKYAAYLDIGDWAICSASHELFFGLDGEIITGRPMKGTVKRGRTTHEDETISNWLHASIKNRAENVMIVDMIRNDIGRIAEIGSVHVPDLFTIEKYPTLFQMTSTVRAKTKASAAEIFGALFPCASITGAPKVSTMNIIAELESSPRRVYCGSIGYIAPNRKARFNVAIRTALVDKQNGKAEYGVGGGIVWDSTSADEYSEALLKARVLTDSPQKEFSPFETLLWTPEDGYFLLDRHIARILDSAEYFGFNPVAAENAEHGGLHTHTGHLARSTEEITKLLNGLVRGATTPKRVKLLMNSQGELSGEVKDLQPSGKVFKVCLAKGPVNSNDRFLFHKTTNRVAYEQAAIQGFDDVLLFNENGELTEFTIGNLVVKMNGQLFTPPVECGLLAGTFRAELVASGEVKERVLRIQDTAEFEAVFLVNSLRKWVKVLLSGQALQVK